MSGVWRRLAAWVLAAFLSPLAAPLQAGETVEAHDPALSALQGAFDEARTRSGFDSAEVVAALQPLLGALMLRGEHGRVLELVDELLATRPAEPLDAAVAAMFDQVSAMRAQVQQGVDLCDATSAPPDVPAAGAMRMVAQSRSARPLDFEPRVSTDGRLLLDVSHSRVIVRDVASGIVVHRFRAGQRLVRKATWLGEGRVAVHTDRCISVWDVATERRLALFPAPFVGNVQALLATPDGQRLVAVYDAAEGLHHGAWALVWRVTAHGPVREYFLDAGWPKLFTLMPGVQTFLSHQGRMLNVSDSFGWHAWPIGADERMRAGAAVVWRHRELLRLAHAGDGEFVKGVAISPDGTSLAITTFGVDEPNRLRILPMDDKGELAMFPVDRRSFPLLPRYSPDGQAVLIGNDEIVRPASGQRQPVQGHCTQTDWMPDGRLLCLSFFDMTLLDLDGSPAGASDSLFSSLARAGELRFSPDGRHLYVGGGSLVRWNIATLYPDGVTYGGGHHSLFFDADTLVAASAQEVYRYDTGRWGARAGAWAGDGDAGRGAEEPLLLAVRASPDRRVLLTADDSGRLRVLEAGAGRVLQDPGVEDTRVSAIAVLAGGRSVASAHEWGLADARNGEIRLWDTAEGRSRVVIPGDGVRVDALRYIGEQGLLVAAGMGGVRAFDAATGEPRAFPRKRYEWASALALSADGRNLYIGWWSVRGPRISAVDTRSGREIASYVAQERVSAIDVAPDGRLLAASLDDGTVQLWNTANADATVQLARAYEDWVVYTPDGYYAASRSGTRLVAAVVEGQPVGLDQLAVQFNRPDVILQRLGLGTPDTILHYRLRHEARLRKAGIAETAARAPVNLPQARILDVRQEGARARLRFSLASSGEVLAAYRVLVNGVPVTGRAKLGARQLTETVELTLVSGRNLVEVVAVDTRGFESLGARRLLHHDAAAAGELYFVGFGVSKYRDSRLDLRYADKDVRDLEKLFTLGTQFAKVHTRRFVNAEVDADAMRQAADFLRQSRVNDTVVVFIAGHGMHDSDREATYYYLPHGADPQRLAETALPFTLIEGLLDDIPARRKLLLIDTCESGELDPTTVAARFRQASASGSRPRTVRGLKIGAGKGDSVRAAPRPYLTQRDRYLYNDLARRTGAVVFASALGHEFAYENDEVRNGFFTEAIIRTLTFARDFTPPPGSRTDAFSLFAAQVREQVVELSEGQQHPVVDRSNIHADLRLDPIPVFFPDTAD